MAECVFCKIASKQIPASIVHEDERLVAFKDLYPQAPVHVLIIPKAHCESFSGLTPEAIEALGGVPQLAARLAAELGIAASGYRLLANCGPDAGQTVPHLHFHLLGGKPLGGKLCN